MPELDQLILNLDFVNTATSTCLRILSEAEGEEGDLDINHTFDATTTTTTPDFHAPHQSTGSLAAPLRSGEVLEKETTSGWLKTGRHTS